MRKFLAIAFVYLLSACGGDSGIQKPDRLIEEDKMVDIFYDLALLEAIKAHNPGVLQNAKEPQKYIYKKYNIDSLQFAQSNRYYASDIKRYKKLYSRVGKRLEQNRQEFDSIVKKKVGAPELPEDGGLVR